MILHFGVRTTEPDLVAYRSLAPGENEGKAITEMLRALSVHEDYLNPRYDHSIVVYYDPPGAENRRREVLIPVPEGVEDVETKVLPSMRAVFLVFCGAESPMEVYYQRLQEYIDGEGLEASDEIYSIEIMYVPEDVDNVDYTIEVMRPLKG